MFSARNAATVLAAAVVLSLGGRAEAVPVDLELSLLVDVSSSVDSTEFGLQRGGYSNAFRSGVIQNAILDTNDGRIGAIAVNFIYWSGAGQQQEAIGWTLIDSAATADAFADSIDAADRAFNGVTAPGSAIAFATPGFSGNGFEGSSLVMDVSGDGAENSGLDAATARDAALAAGIDRINGIAILGETGLSEFYQNEIVGGSGSFLLTAASFEDFETAIAQKLQAEITNQPPGMTPIPLPASVWLLIAALGGLGALRASRLA